MNHILGLITPGMLGMDFGIGLGPFEPFVPDFGQPEIIDIPSSEITDLSEETWN